MACFLSCERNYRPRVNSTSLYTSFRPAGGNFSVENGNNQAFTTLSYNGKLTSEWTDGGNHSNFVRTTLSSIKYFFDFEPYRTILSMTSVLHLPIVCLSSFGAVISQLEFSPLVHTQNESQAAGTAFAISYHVCSFPLFCSL